ncbi:glycosyltransferase family 9 protein [Pseudomonadota bacterium]
MSSLKFLVHKNRKLDASINFDKISILFLSQNRVGDTLITTPIFSALKRVYPNCTIDILLSRRNAETLENNPHIRLRYIIKQKPFDLVNIIFRVRKRRYDFVVDLIPSKSATSTAICLLCKASYTVGLIRENDFAYDIKVAPLIRSDSGGVGIRMVENVAQVLRPFGITPSLDTLKTEYYPNADSFKFAQQVVDKLVVTSGRNGKSLTVGINISASKQAKFWGVENFIGMAKSIQKIYPSASIIILYSNAYKLEAEQISKQGNVALCDETKSLSEFAAIISKLDLLITPDSASVHLADIYHVPLVILTSEPHNQQYWYPILSEFETLHAPAHQPISHISLSEVEAAFVKLARRVDFDLG